MLRDSWTKNMCTSIDSIQKFYNNLNNSVFVLDSSYILSNKSLPLSYITLVPTVVLDELWGLQANIGKKLRKRAKYATKVTERFIEESEIFTLVEPYQFEEVRHIFSSIKAKGKDIDGLILSLCIFLQLQNPQKRIVLLTNDRGLIKRCKREYIKTEIE